MTATVEGEIEVTPWRTPDKTDQDPTAQWHDCLWEIAAEQATLEYMEQGLDWETAANKVTVADIRRHLDKICNDNGFRRLDGSGSGHDPNLIAIGQPIKVERNPLQLTTRPTGLSTGRGSQTDEAYDTAVGGPYHTNLVIKRDLDKFLSDIRNLAELSDGAQAALIRAYMRDTDKTKLAALVNTEAFRKLPPEQQKQLLNVYGQKGNEATTAALDRAVAHSKDPAKLGKFFQEALAIYTGEVIPSGTTLDLDQSFTSPNGEYKLTVGNSDGKFVLSLNCKPILTLPTGSSEGDHLVWQSDGNLVVYRADGSEAWSSKTAGHEGARLVLQGDRLTIYDKNGRELWSSK